MLFQLFKFFRICLAYFDNNPEKIKLFIGHPFWATSAVINLRKLKPLLSPFKKSFLPILVFILCAAIAKHPYHVGVTEITLNSSSQTIQVRCKLLTNDLQDAIIAQQKTPIDLTIKSQVNKVLLGKFLLNGLQLQLSKQAITKQTQIRIQSPILLNFLGWEIEEDAVWCYLEANNTHPQKNIWVCNTLLFEQFSGQTHFVHCLFNGTRKSHKLSNPEGCTSFQF